MELSSPRGLRDDDAWVRLEGDDQPGRRWRLAGNAHTHRGHFHVETDGGATGTANLADVVAASPLARAWLSGFVQGQEPELSEFLGSDDDLLDAADEADVQRWQAWNAWFRQRGYAPRLQFLPPADEVLAAVADPPAWVLVGGLYRLYRDGAWVVADPQPQQARPDTWAWPGSVCEQRGHHALSRLGEHLTLCEDCHEASG